MQEMGIEHAVAGSSVHRRAAEVFRPKQCFVFVRELCDVSPPLLRRVYLSSRFLNDPGVQKVILQPAIIGVEEARSAHQGECKDMLIVGRRKPVSDERLLAFADYLVPCLPYPTSLSSFFSEPSLEVSILCQLFQVSSTDDEDSPATVQPVPEPHARFGLFSAEHLEGHIGVDNRAHQ